MKRLFFLVLIVALYFVSWWWFKKTDSVHVSEKIHMELQQAVVNRLPEMVLKDNPGAFEVQVKRYWSKEMDPKEVRVFFEVGYKEKSELGTTDVVKNGYAVLIKTGKQGDKELWESKEIRVEGQKLSFPEGLRI